MTELETLEIRLKMEELITEREGMIAENVRRAWRQESPAFDGDDFTRLSAQFFDLREELRLSQKR